MTQEKAIRIHEKSLIPADIIESDLSLQSYLAANVIENRKHEKIRQRIAKAQRTRINHALQAAARKIKVEPGSTDAKSAGPGPSAQQQRSKPWNKYEEPTKQQKTKKWNVKEVTIEERGVAICNNTLEDSRIIVEKRVGYKVTCPRCNYSWVWHGKRDRFYVSCSRCHKSFKLNWK